MYLLFVMPAAFLLFFLYLVPLARILVISATDGQGFAANYGAVLTSEPIHRMGGPRRSISGRPLVPCGPRCRPAGWA